MSPNLDLLRTDDAAAALALSTSEGSNETVADRARCLELAPRGCFAARSRDALVGTVTIVPDRGALTWIGMMLVHYEHRRRESAAR